MCRLEASMRTTELLLTWRSTLSRPTPQYRGTTPINQHHKPLFSGKPFMWGRQAASVLRLCFCFGQKCPHNGSIRSLMEGRLAAPTCLRCADPTLETTWTLRFLPSSDFRCTGNNSSTCYIRKCEGRSLALLDFCRQAS